MMILKGHGASASAAPTAAVNDHKLMGVPRAAAGRRKVQAAVLGHPAP